MPATRTRRLKYCCGCCCFIVHPIVWILILFVGPPIVESIVKSKARFNVCTLQFCTGPAAPGTCAPCNTTACPALVANRGQTVNRLSFQITFSAYNPVLIGVDVHAVQLLLHPLGTEVSGTVSAAKEGASWQLCRVREMQGET